MKLGKLSGLAKYGSRFVGGAFALGFIGYFNQQLSSHSSSECKVAAKSPNHFTYGVSMRPHPQKIAKGGEDACFADENLLAVADGVGGWAELGVDPALYSRMLISNVESIYKSEKQRLIDNPKLLLMRAAKNTDILGSSTLVIVTLNKDKAIAKSSYMGDSGYCIYRFDPISEELKLVYGFQEQQKSFNFPYQLGAGDNGDPPEQALQFEHKLEDQDVIVVGSDGLFDNMDFEQIGEILNDSRRRVSGGESISLQVLADEIAEKAKMYSLSYFYDSPFSKKARAAKVQMRIGGKSDDVSVIVARANLASST